MKTFLITGVTGFLGSKLAMHLLQQNHTVIGLGRKEKNLNLNELEGYSNFIYLYGEISEDFLYQLESYKISGVFHLASQIPNQNSLNYADYYDANVATTLMLINYLKSKRLDFFVYTSTNSVFGQPVFGKINEDSVPTPMNYYGLTKYIGEKIIEIEGAKLQTKSIVIRFCSLFGKDDTYGFLNTVSTEIEKGLDVELFSQGKIYRSLLLVDDAVKLLGNIVFKFQTLESFEIFQIAGQRSLQTIEIAELVKAHLNSSSNIILSDKQSRYDWSVFVDISKAQQKLDFKPSSMEDSIQYYLNK